MRKGLLYGGCLFLAGCGTMNPAALKEYSVKYETTVNARSSEIARCMTDKIDNYEIHGLGGNEQPALVRSYTDRVEIYLSPSLTVLEDINDSCKATFYVAKSYWKHRDLSESLTRFARECSEVEP